MSEANLVDFVESSKKITEVLNLRTADMAEDERIRYVYNMATEDAINWVTEMGQRNPDIRLACMRLVDSMKEWLPLRKKEELK